LAAVLALAAVAGAETAGSAGAAEEPRREAGTSEKGEGKGAAAAVHVDAKLPEYKPVEGVSGTITSAGSDTMGNLMLLWVGGFQKHYPNVQKSVKSEGSSSAPVALVEGTAAFGPMSREMKAAEIDAFEKKYGYKPVAVPTSLDVLAVYVNKDNPIASRGLTLARVDAIFSKDRKRGAPEAITKWGQLGLTGEWANAPISLYGRNSASGTYGYFKEHTLAKGDFSDAVKEQPGSSAVVQGVASDKFAIGYSGIGYLTADVRAVPLAEKGDKFVTAAAEHAFDGTYPLARPLLIYVNAKPGEGLRNDPLRREFVRYILSRDGQQDVIKEGFFPITAVMAERALRAAGLGSTPAGASASR
jgi:phosphate transport system substrate-binding protein